MNRPWSPYTKRHTFGVTFQGFPTAQFKIYHDKAERFLQIHATHLTSFADYSTKRFWLPDEVWSDLRHAIDAVEWCVRSDVTCYRISGQDCETHGRAVEVPRWGSRTQTDQVWAVPMGRTEKVVLEDDEPKVRELRL